VLTVFDTFAQVERLCEQGSFAQAAWRAYAQALPAGVPEACIKEFEIVLAMPSIAFDTHYAPVYKRLWDNPVLRAQAHQNFVRVVDGLQQQVVAAFGRSPQVDIVWYLGLCNGAGWVTDFHGRTHMLLGIEKIIELDWGNLPRLTGLVHHEMGHVYHAQFGTLASTPPDDPAQFIWQLFTEGVAMCFEHRLADSFDSYHQYGQGWKSWCDANLARIAADFDADLPTITRATQRWFGDWVLYRGHSDVGYYLGSKFVQHILRHMPFDDVIQLTLQDVMGWYDRYLAQVTQDTAEPFVTDSD